MHSVFAFGPILADYGLEYTMVIAHDICFAVLSLNGHVVQFTLTAA